MQTDTLSVQCCIVQYLHFYFFIVLEVDCIRMTNISRIEALRGNFFSSNRLASVISWQAPTRKLLVFVLSATTDACEERKIILEKIIPDLRNASRSKGIDIIILESPSGLSTDSASSDNRTWIGKCS